MTSFVLLNLEIETQSTRSVNVPLGNSKESPSKTVFLCGKKIYEPKLFSVKYGSWLCNQIISSDNSVLIFTELNPIYCLLTLLDETVHNKTLLILSDFLTNECYTGLSLLKPFFTEELIGQICVWTNCEDDIACRLDSGTLVAMF